VLEVKSKSEEVHRKQEEFKIIMSNPKITIQVFKMDIINKINILVEAKNKNIQTNMVTNKIILIKNQIKFKKKSKVQIKI
jgi:hypothetical protein